MTNSIDNLDQRAAIIAVDGAHTFGTETADVSVEGVTKINENATVALDGKSVTLTATGEDAALYSQGSTRVGSDQTERPRLKDGSIRLVLTERPFWDKNHDGRYGQCVRKKSMLVLR